MCTNDIEHLCNGEWPKPNFADAMMQLYCKRKYGENCVEFPTQWKDPNAFLSFSPSLYYNFKYQFMLQTALKLETTFVSIQDVGEQGVIAFLYKWVSTWAEWDLKPSLNFHTFILFANLGDCHDTSSTCDNHGKSRLEKDCKMGVKCCFCLSLSVGFEPPRPGRKGASGEGVVQTCIVTIWDGSNNDLCKLRFLWRAL